MPLRNDGDPKRVILTQNGEVGRKGLNKERTFALDFKEQARFLQLRGRKIKKVTPKKNSGQEVGGEKHAFRKHLTASIYWVLTQRESLPRD